MRNTWTRYHLAIKNNVKKLGSQKVNTENNNLINDARKTTKCPITCGMNALVSFWLVNFLIWARSIWFTANDKYNAHVRRLENEQQEDNTHVRASGMYFGNQSWTRKWPATAAWGETGGSWRLHPSLRSLDSIQVSLLVQLTWLRLPGTKLPRPIRQNCAALWSFVLISTLWRFTITRATSE